MARISQTALAESAAALQAKDIGLALDVCAAERGVRSPFDDSTTAVLELILCRTPQILNDCPAAIMGPLRVAAAMMELWGTNTIKDFVTIEGIWDYRFDASEVAFLMHAHASFLHRLATFRELGIHQVALLGSKDPADCDACRAANGQRFTISTVPELPLKDCECETGYGCRVIMIADAAVVTR